MAASPFYTAGQGYGSNQDWTTTPFVTDFLDPTIPQGVYQNYLSRQGLGGFDRQGQFAQGLYGRTQQGYQAALRENPALSYQDYLNTQFGNNGMQNIWAGLAPSQQGINTSTWTGPTRIIANG